MPRDADPTRAAEPRPAIARRTPKERVEAPRKTPAEIRASQSGPVTTPGDSLDAPSPAEPGEGPIGPQEAYLLLQDVDALAADFRFDRALAVLDEGIERCPHEATRKDLRDRRSDLELLDRFHADVVRAIDTRAGRAQAIPTLGGRRVAGADPDGVRLGEGIVLAWSMIEPEALVAMCEKLALPREDRIALAIYCFDRCFERRSFEKEAHRILADLVREDPSSRPEVEQVLARKIGIERPEGGFVYWQPEGRWVTQRRYEALREEAHLADLRSRLHEEDGDRRRLAVAELRGRGEPGIEILRDELPRARDGIRDRLRRDDTFRSLASLRAEREELERLRAEILGLVFDLQKYPSVYKAHEAPEEDHEAYLETQKKIDRLLVTIGALWKSAETRRVALPGRFRRQLGHLRDVLDWCVELGIPFDREEEPRFLALLGPDQKEVTIRSFPLYEDDVEWRLACAEALDANRRYQGVAAADEAELVAITNEYRMMLGRRALAIDDRLVRAARGHSEEMSRLGYFAHKSPVPDNATPADRARNEGFTGTGIGENIARGKVGARASHELWLRSPPHHRNILATEWNEQGTGRSGHYWTSMFGRR
jgi:uncharacterized protein YkwD